MAIAAYLDESTKTEGSPRLARRTLRLETRGTLPSGAATNVLIHNVSATGLLLESGESLAEGERIEIDLPQAGETVAKVIWTSGRLFGCQFEAPISNASLSAAQLRGAVGQVADIAAPRTPATDITFGVRLQSLRKARGLTLSQIAARLGVSKPTVWAWERGKARPVESRIEALAAALGVPAAELLAGSDTAGLSELLLRSKAQIAAAFGADPEKVRIMIEL